jgi:hypothetical protein
VKVEAAGAVQSRRIGFIVLPSGAKSRGPSGCYHLSSAPIGRINKILVLPGSRKYCWMNEVKP